MLDKLKLRLRALFFRSKMEEELDEEVRFHLGREIEEETARGMSPEEARLAALSESRKRAGMNAASGLRRTTCSTSRTFSIPRATCAALITARS
jgi:hypothetical protein